MKRNFSELEQRLIYILKRDSRKNLSDIAEELGVSRVTARKTMDSLLESGRISSFTIRLDSDETDLAIIHLENTEELPADLIAEDYQLIDGTHLVVLYYEDLMKVKGARVLDVKIARRKTTNENYDRAVHLHCDLCESEITGTPIRVSVNRKVFYACCPTCEKGLVRRLNAEAR